MRDAADRIGHLLHIIITNGRNRLPLLLFLSQEGRSACGFLNIENSHKYQIHYDRTKNHC